MARATSLTLDWGDGTYLFRLAIAQLEEHDEKCGAGPLAVLRRLGDGTWRVADLRETIRLGLIGGGVESGRALVLVRRYVDAVPLIQSVPIAQVILAAALAGEAAPADGDAAGNAAAAQSTTEPDTTGSTSPPFAGAPSQSASPTATSAP